jgi:hypothetical protein
VRRHGPPVAGTEFLQPLAPVGAARLVAGDPLREEQTLEAVGVPDALADQGLELAAEPAPVLLLWGRHPDHRADAGLAPLVRQQSADQRLAVDSVRLRPTAPALHSDGCGIDDMALDALLP